MSVTHKSSVSFIGRTQKTAKTECGKTVKVASLAMYSKPTCPECVSVVEGSIKAMLSMATTTEEKYGASLLTREARDMAANPVMFHTVYFL